MNKELYKQSAIDGVTFEGRHSAVIAASDIKPEDLTAGLINTLLELNKDVFYHESRLSDDVGIAFYNKTGRNNKYPISCYKVFFAENRVSDEEFDMKFPLLFSPNRKDKAIEVFLHAVKVGNLSGNPGGNSSEEDICVTYYGWEAFTSQYSYCSAMLEGVWGKVFNKTPEAMWCSGIVSAHGDKCYGYKSSWEKAGVPFYRGTMLYLLSYTSQFKEESRHDMEKWVIDNYPKYLPMLEEVEKKVQLERFT